jgi:hypothetical protein
LYMADNVGEERCRLRFHEAVECRYRMPKNRVWLWNPAIRGPINCDHFIKQRFNPEHNIVLST